MFRGTSLLVQLFWIFFVLPEFGINLSPFVASVAGLTLNFAAYGGEVVRGAILSIPRGRSNAVLALNISRSRAIRRIILPQAVIPMIPPFGNLCVDLTKSTSLVSAITLQDLTFAAYQINRALLRTFQIFGVAMLIYYIFSQVIRISFEHLELKLARGLSRDAVSIMWNWQFTFNEVMPRLISVFPVTIAATVFGFGLAVTLGLLLALLRMVRLPWIAVPVREFCEFIRGTPYWYKFFSYSLFCQA